MELGEKLKQARLAAGLSQRQLCGDVITRNMLSQIENGAARPSMDTLRYLAGRLGKNLSWFLEEEEPVSPREQQLMAQLQTLEQAALAIEEGRGIYAGELLDTLQIRQEDCCAAELERKRLLLLAKAQPQRCGEVCEKLPSLDEELLVRARDALNRGALVRAAALLDSMEAQEDPLRNFLRGEVYLAEADFGAAAGCFHRAEAAFPERTAPYLERCYRELGDYRLAYEYACKHR